MTAQTQYEPRVQVQGWSTKTITRKGVRHIELRKTLAYPHHQGAQILLVVALDGYNLDASFHGDDRVEADKWNRSSKGVQVRMSLNNSARMTIAEFAEINEITLDAYRWLRDHT